MPTAHTVLAFAASNNSQSINKRFAEHAASDLRTELMPELNVDTLDLNDYEMPIYSPDREKADGIPLQAQNFLAKIAAADGLIISYAEYNGSYTAAFKNVFDWASRIDTKIYQNKPVLALATSPGKRGGQNVLKVALDAAPHFGANIIGSLSVGPYREHFDSQTGRLSQPEKITALQDALINLRDALTTRAA